jgi:hypothetical protein
MINTLICPCCKKSFIKTKINQKYCSDKCRIKFCVSNWRLKNKKLCPLCGVTKINHESKQCLECHRDSIKAGSQNKTIEEFINLLSVKGKHPSWRFNHIRSMARYWHSDLLEKPCNHCGYDKHVDLCHIKPIASFPLDAKISEVNAKENVIQLCPNCHWELDHKQKMVAPSEFPSESPPSQSGVI